jgi:hypothetical protein
MSAIDSVATFREAVVERGLGDFLQRFDELGWETLSDLVFATNYTPRGLERADEELFVNEIVIPVLGDATHRSRPRLRRLFFEAFAMSAAQIKRTVEANPTEVTRVISAPERAERRRRVEARLVMLTDEDGHFPEELDISDALIDRCITMYEANSVAYLGLEFCTKKKLELVRVNKDPAWQPIPDANGVLKMKQTEDDERIVLNTQFDLLHALQRRSIGMECGDLMSFESHEMIRRKLLSAYNKTPLKGFLPVSIDQLLEADQIIWGLLYKKTRDGIKKRNLLVRPLEAALPAVLAHLDVQMALMPRQGAAPRSQPAETPKADLPSKLVSALQKQIDDLKRASAISGAFNGASSSAAGAGKQGPKAELPMSRGQKRKQAIESTENRPVRLPKGLEGCSTVSNAATSKKRMCFSYNMTGCNKAKPGGTCVKGVHLCMKTVGGEACSMPHAQHSCTR